jgi:DNA-binding transcriptional LysR family regulator
MRFDWTDLQVFLQVCDAGSMTAAAQRCHLTLAAVSARMRGLEEANGVVLLQRQARGVSPTLAGEILARHARLVFEQVQRLERELLQAQGAPLQPLVLLANSSALARPLAAALGECVGDTPLVVRESPSEATVQALRSGAAGLGIVSDAVDTRGLLARELGPDPLVLVLAPGHALTAHASVPFEAVLAHPWIAWGEQSALSAHLQLRAAALGAQLQARITYPRAPGVLQLVSQGLGVTVLPQAVVDLHASRGSVACVRLEERWAQRRLLVCHRDGGTALRAGLAEALVRTWRGAPGGNRTHI